MKTQRLTKEYLLELGIIIAAYRAAGMPREALIRDINDPDFYTLFATDFVLDTYKKNKETMSKLKRVWQEAP